MTSQDFRRHGHAMVDWVAEYLERAEQLPRVTLTDTRVSDLEMIAVGAIGSVVLVAA